MPISTIGSAGLDQAANVTLCTTSGNLGVGTASPAGKVELVTQNTNDDGLYLTADGTSFGYASNITFRSKLTTGGSIGVAAKIRSELSSSNNAGLLFFTTASGTNAEKMRLDASGNLLLNTTGSPAASAKMKIATSARTGAFFDLTATGGENWIIDSTNTSGSTDVLGIYASGATGMYLTDTGNLLVGTTSAGGIGISIQPAATLILNNNAAATGFVFQSYRRSSVEIGFIDQNGTTAVRYSTTSDYRLKENVAPMTGALATVSALKPVTYKWKSDGSDGQGFIAHELQAVVPDCVTGSKDAVDDEGNPKYQGVDTSFLVATLTAAIQELKAIVDAQAVEIAALKGRV
jgi:hypothetical protein